MDYYQYSIHTETAEVAEIILALLSELPFDTFQETEAGVDAFLPVAVFSNTLEDQTEEIINRFNGSFTKTFIKGQNWNELWESNFSPIQVGDFCALRADFHPAFPNVRYDIIINPKMAFGTGHHATTYMMIDAMKELDFGCGTGVLAILASLMYAKQVEAVDIEAPAFENAKENLLINKVENVDLFLGGIAQIQVNDFDVILANINRNVILSSFHTLYLKLNQGGKLLISGILTEDEEQVLSKGRDAGFMHLSTLRRKDWLCMLWEK